MENCSVLLKESLCMFGSLETVLTGSWQSIKGAKVAFFRSSPSKCLSKIFLPPPPKKKKKNDNNYYTTKIVQCIVFD